MNVTRPKQELPAEIVGDLLGAIKRDFCAEMGARQWVQSKRFLMRVVTYPASRLNAQGVTVAPERYKEILLEIFKGIKQHGQTGAVKFWPGYLLKCVQSHWEVHGEEYYQEAKGIRERVAVASRAYAGATIVDRVPDAMPELAALHVLVKVTKRKKVAKEEGTQGTLLGL